MHLNIKNGEAHRLATEIAQLTGESVSHAVTEALRERLSRLRAEQNTLADRLLALGRDCAARLGEPYKSIDHGALLYDDAGSRR